MTDKIRSLKFKQFVNTSPLEVYEALTSATAFTEWLCDVAQADVHPGGRLYLYWQTGYYASGEFMELKPAQRVLYSWHGRGEPGLTYVKVSLKPEGDGTRLSLTHYGLGPGKAWKSAHKQFKSGWERSLENLKSVLETGMDLRFFRQPLLGVVGLEHIDAEQAAEAGIPEGGGVRLIGIVEGMSAQAAGLDTNDVIVKFNGKQVNTVAGLIELVRELRAGDQAKAVFYRKGVKQRVKIELAERPKPKIPTTSDALGAAAKSMFENLNANLLACLEDLSEEEAEYRPGPEEWSVKQNLAHLIATEREVHAWLASMIEDQEAGFSFHGNNPTRLSATVSTFPHLKDLMEELRRNQAETVAMAAGLPEEIVARKRTYFRLAVNLLSTPYHYHDHCAQIQSLVSLAKNKALSEISNTHLPKEVEL